MEDKVGNAVTIGVAMMMVLLVVTSCAYKGIYVNRDYSYLCSNMSKYYTPDVFANRLYFDDLNTGAFNDYHYVSNDLRKALDENAYIKSLINQIKDNPKKAGLYEEKLKKEKEILHQQFEKRIEERKRFLEKFYADIYELSNRDFTKYYRKYCSLELRRQLKAVYKSNYKSSGYAWTCFTDGQMHKSDSIRVMYLDGNPALVKNKKIAFYMFGDSVKHRVPDVRYTEVEDKWFCVELGDHYIMVQLRGTGKSTEIMGVVNPYQWFATKVEEWPRRRARR